MALKGVNLGGWLVAEKWMTPSLFAGTQARNEYQLSQTDIGKRRLRKHHDTFITERDIRWLAGHGFQLLRVPVGHWVFGDAPPYVGAIDRLDWLMSIAKKYHLRVLIDLHAAPGAQNTRDHSGSGNQPHGSAWLKNKTAKLQTIEILCRLADRYKGETSVWGIELINEPACDPTGLHLVWFYRKAYRRLTQVARPGTRIVFSDAFRPWLISGTFWGMTNKQFPVVMDVHLYQCFGERNKTKSFNRQLAATRRRKWYLRLLSLVQPVIVGEWSGALAIRTSNVQTRAFITIQKAAYEQSEAWSYWSYKTEGGGVWNMRNATKRDMLQ